MLPTCPTHLTLDFVTLTVFDPHILHLFNIYFNIIVVWLGLRCGIYSYCPARVYICIYHLSCLLRPLPISLLISPPKLSLPSPQIFSWTSDSRLVLVETQLSHLYRKFWDVKWHRIWQKYIKSASVMVDFASRHWPFISQLFGRCVRTS
jgi:hypothetical protein